MSPARKRAAQAETDQDSGPLDHKTVAVGLLSLELLTQCLSYLELAVLCKSRMTNKQVYLAATNLLSTLDDCELGGPLFIDQLGLPVLLASCPKMSTLGLDCRALTDDSLRSVARVLGSLRELRLHHGYSLTAEGMAHVAQPLEEEGDGQPLRLQSLCLAHMGTSGLRKSCQGSDMEATRVLWALRELLLRSPELHCLSIAGWSQWFMAQLLGFLVSPGATPLLRRLTDLTLDRLHVQHADALLTALAEAAAPADGGSTAGAGGRGAGPVQLTRLNMVVSHITDGLCQTISKALRLSLCELILRDSHGDAGCHDWDVGAAPDELSDMGLQCLGACAKLSKLSLSRGRGQFRKCSDVGLIFMAQRLAEVEHLTLVGFCRATDTALGAVFDKCPKLTHLNLQGLQQFLGQVFYRGYNIGRVALPPLSSLNLSRCREIQPGALGALAWSLSPQLRELNLAMCLVDDDLLPVVLAMPNLRNLVLNHCMISDAGFLTALRQAEEGMGQAGPPTCVPRLEKLAMAWCAEVSGLAIAALCSGGHIGPDLVCLDLTGVWAMTDEAVKELCRAATRLLELKLRQCSSLTPLTLQHLSGALGGYLQLLDVSGAMVLRSGQSGHLLPPNLPKLCTLALSSSQGISKQALAQIAACRPHCWLTCDDVDVNAQA